MKRGWLLAVGVSGSVALAGGAILAGTATSDGGSDAAASAPASESSFAWPADAKLGNVQLRVVADPANEHVCVASRVDGETPDTMCAPAADLARDGAIFGLQRGDGPIRVYGMAPLGTEPVALTGGRVIDFSSGNGVFFQGTIVSAQGFSVSFQRPDGSTVVRHLANP